MERETSGEVIVRAEIAIDLPPKKWAWLSGSAFHLGRADVAEGRVQAAGIVEALYVPE
ncbi:MAG TPA: hypothetical protein PK706_12755 [Xanthobacteraceae bacterium]|jgi:hypothetical protein|nr:hypothetical protein [Xanthobacteraceae bacterium]